MNPIAVVWVILTSIYFCLPFYGPPAVFWDDAFDWNAVNFTPLVMGGLVIAITLAWVLGMNKKYTGPIRTIEFDEGMGIKEEKPADRAAASAAPPAGSPPTSSRLAAAANELAPALVLGRAPGVVSRGLHAAVHRQ